MKIKKKLFKPPSRATLTIMMGVPGVGKSTFLRKIIRENDKKRIIVCPDEIRFNLLDSDTTGTFHDSTIEPQVWRITKNLVKESLLNAQLKECILDATNVGSTHRNEFIKMAQEQDWRTRGIVLYESYEKIKNRNLLRKRKVPEEVIEEFYVKFQHPRRGEFDELYKIGSIKKFERYRKLLQSNDIILNIDGFEIMKALKIEPGKQVGMVIQHLKNEIKEGRLKNKKKLLREECLKTFKTK
jgi:predicted kinase